MNTISTVVFIVFGIVGPIAVEALHTFVYVKELLVPEVEARLQSEISIPGN